MKNYLNERISIETANYWVRLAYNRGYKVGRKRRTKMSEEQFKKFIEAVREGVVQIAEGVPWIENYELRGALKDVGIEVKQKSKKEGE